MRRSILTFFTAIVRNDFQGKKKKLGGIVGSYLSGKNLLLIQLVTITDTLFHSTAGNESNYRYNCPGTKTPDNVIMTVIYQVYVYFTTSHVQVSLSNVYVRNRNFVEGTGVLFLALLCATAQQSYCHDVGVRRP